jgi:hypothetical protein
MRTIFFMSSLLILLASCSTTQQTPEMKPVDATVPPEATIQSGYAYPAVPLDQYNQMNSGSVPAV